MPPTIRDIRDKNVIYGPINSKAPDVIRRLESSTDIVAWKCRGTKPNQICILLIPSNDHIIDKVASFEARLAGWAQSLRAYRST